jgi:hypothetical protein
MCCPATPNTFHRGARGIVSAWWRVSVWRSVEAFAASPVFSMIFRVALEERARWRRRRHPCREAPSGAAAPRHRAAFEKLDAAGADAPKSAALRPCAHPGSALWLEINGLPDRPDATWDPTLAP